MPKWICEISASSWFYYKEICYDARTHERKIRFLYISYAIKTELLRLNIAIVCTKIFEVLF